MCPQTHFQCELPFTQLNADLFGNPDDWTQMFTNIDQIHNVLDWIGTVMNGPFASCFPGEARAANWLLLKAPIDITSPMTFGKTDITSI